VKSITEDILSWSKDFLEKPNKHLNGYPVCPYAKKTRINKKIRIVEHHNTDTLLEKIVEECNNFTSNNNKICIVACNNMYVTADELHDYIHALNHVYVPQDVYLMASHPEDAEEEIMPRTLTKKQKKIDVAKPFGKITGADLKKLGKKKKKKKK